ncbi:MAG: hypothetical protein Q8918_18565 [Bacteroidota bacterium]|nr:hypothetical protein [Bacteroidota bacterium]
MKKNLSIGSVILISFLICLLACRKTIDSIETVPNKPPVKVDSAKNQVDSTKSTPDTTAVPYPQTPMLGCTYSPDYGDSIVFTQPPHGQDYVVSPINNTGVTGTYFAWPGGLVLDSHTGAIDLTKSETGARYEIGFVKAGTTDTCMSQLIVGGAAYMDSVYVLSQSDTTAAPYFNADPYGPPVCSGSGSQGGPGCQFDYNNAAKNQGVEVDNHTGFIDLQKTMKNSLFGLLPLDGTTVNTTIYYKLNDNSNLAPQKIQLKLMFYNKKSSIPPSLLASITNKLVNTLENLLLIKSSTSPRPPLIIITRYN